MAGFISKKQMVCLQLVEGALSILNNQSVRFESINFRSRTGDVVISGQVQSLTITKYDFDCVEFSMCGEFFSVHHEFGVKDVPITIFRGRSRAAGFTGTVVTTITGRTPIISQS